MCCAQTVLHNNESIRILSQLASVYFAGYTNEARVATCKIDKHAFEQKAIAEAFITNMCLHYCIDAPTVSLPHASESRLASNVPDLKIA